MLYTVLKKLIQTWEKFCT